jgi:uncharacterized protein YbjT (DUF2867 family)
VGSAPLLVTGATGNVGREVVRALLEAGEPVRVGVRDPASARLPAGVEVVRVDFEDPSSFAPAVGGARGLFLLRPPAIARVGPTLNRLADVATAGGVRHGVFLSVAGAERNRVVPHHRVERHLARSGRPWTVLRPGFFAQNLTGPYRDDIRAGRIVVPAADGRVAFVDARDLGDVAADALRRPEVHAGRAYHLTGPAAVPFAEVAELLSAVLGRPVRYVPASVRRYVGHLRAQGLPAAQVLVQTVLHVGLRRGDAEEVDPTLPHLLGRPARTVAQFVADHAEAWR